MINKIAIIIPWYGEIPTYLPLFLKGLEFNTSILDVLFITDLEVKDSVPTNFKKISLSWEDLNKRIKKSIGKEANLETPYKLCDFRPMYGRIFEEEIAEYEFWGYGDIDLIYGDLKRFLPFDGIEKYDVLTFRENLMHGPFSILRNNSYIRNLYTKTNKLIDIISNPNCMAFDEAVLSKPWRDGVRLYNLIELDGTWDWSSIIQHEADNGKLKLFERYYCLEAIQSESVLVYNRGKLNIGMEEYAFFHWVYHKKLNNFHIPQWKVVPDNFFIHKSGFYKKINWLFFFEKRKREYKGKIITLYIKIRDSYNYQIKGKSAKSI